MHINKRIKRSNQAIMTTDIGKRKLILKEESDEGEELLSRATDILEDASKNKIYVEMQFKCFIEE